MPRSLKLPVGFAPSHLQVQVAAASPRERRGAATSGVEPSPSETSLRSARSRPSELRDAAIRDHGQRPRALVHLGQRSERLERVVERARARLVRDDVQARRRCRSAAAAAARSRRRAARARRRPARARPAGPRRRDGSRTASCCRPAAAAAARASAASFCRKPVPIVPITLTMSAITADAVSMPPAPGPSSVISRIASPCSMTALNAPSTLASGCCLSTSAGWTRTSKLPSTSRAAPTSRITMSSSRAAVDVGGVDLVMPRYVDVGEVDPRVERDGREDRHLRRRVRARDVVGRVGLGVAAPLRVGERLVVASCPPPSR